MLRKIQTMKTICSFLWAGDKNDAQIWPLVCSIKFSKSSSILYCQKSHSHNGLFILPHLKSCMASAENTPHHSDVFIRERLTCFYINQSVHLLPQHSCVVKAQVWNWPVWPPQRNKKNNHGNNFKYKTTVRVNK